MGSLTGSTIRRVAIIGGGPSGIATAKVLLQEESFHDIQILEQSDSIEGAWRHSALGDNDGISSIPQTNPLQPLEKPKMDQNRDGGIVFTTPMYDNLETNIPHQLMQYSDNPFRPELPLYPPRESVSQYLEAYATDVSQRIQFHTQVQDLHFAPIDGKDAWLLRSCDLQSRDQRTQSFDAVAICTGHYSTPFLPKVPGIENWAKAYPGSVRHSKFYRASSSFAAKKTVIVGNSASGMDIANQIAKVSKLPLFISQRSMSWLSGSQSKSEEERIVMKPQIEEFLDPEKYSRALRFTDGHVEEDIDCILFCTGYLYSFPFLSSFLSELITDGFRVHGLYEHVFFTKHPSLAFIALPIRVIPFPLAEMQALVIAKVWSGQLSLPTQEEMREWEKRTVAENGEGKKFLTLDGGKDFKYHNELYAWVEKAGFANSLKPHKWTDKEFWLRSKFPDMKRAYAQRGEERFNIRTLEELGFDYESTKRCPN